MNSYPIGYYSSISVNPTRYISSGGFPTTYILHELNRVSVTMTDVTTMFTMMRITTGMPSHANYWPNSPLIVIPRSAATVTWIDKIIRESIKSTFILKITKFKCIGTRYTSEPAIHFFHFVCRYKVVPTVIGTYSG